jgi:hypothetical protein
MQSRLDMRWRTNENVPARKFPEGSRGMWDMILAAQDANISADHSNS